MPSRLPLIRPHSIAQWMRGMAVLLVGAMLMQGLPLHALIGHEAAPCLCAEKGYCAWNPGEGAHERCDHHQGHSPGHAAGHSTDEAPASHGPILQACGDMQPNAPAVMMSLKAFLPSFDRWAAPAGEPDLHAVVTGLRSQRTVTDIFHPPKHRIG